MNYRQYTDRQKQNHSFQDTYITDISQVKDSKGQVMSSSSSSIEYLYSASGALTPQKRYLLPLH